jgi:hypothetical protein
MFYYSKTTKGFYSEEIHGTNIPSDAVQITSKQHADLLNEQSQGKQIVPDKKGYPIAIVPPAVALTWDQIRLQRDALLIASDWTDLPNSPVKNKGAWLAYRRALRDLPITFSTPEEVVWPERP